MTIPNVTNPTLADLPSHVLWLDLETTGLDPHTCNILEVAASLAVFDDPFDTYEVVNTPILFVRTLHGLDEFVVRMHTANGLFRACRETTAPTLNDVERTILSALSPILSTSTSEKRIVLAGSSVHFDLSFLRVHMPKLASVLSHRVYDVSAIKLFCQSLGMPPFPKSEEHHRASGDVVASIDHARACEEWLRSHMPFNVLPRSMQRLAVEQR